MKCAIRTADKMYKRHSDNKQLIERLKKAVKSRNYIAHQVVREYMRHREAKPRVVATISRELKKLEDDGQDLAEELLKELAALREAYDEDQRVKSAMEYRRLSSRGIGKDAYNAVLRSGRATPKKSQRSSNADNYTSEGNIPQRL